ncbi:hypothetical protein AK812_SmicGene48610, partial [Symbiodinium microadriaticum]
VLILSVDQLHGLAEGHLKDYRREDADEHYALLLRFSSGSFGDTADPSFLRLS